MGKTVHPVHTTVNRDVHPAYNYFGRKCTPAFKDWLSRGFYEGFCDFDNLPPFTGLGLVPD